jgi:D-beta-D-heptose 7-phosphate kinase/D-beta-D-heptose 1-phosphate adenosyltransferase
MSPERLEELLTAFRDRRVLVVGDAMLDEYVWCRPARLSPEAPVMVVEEERTTYAAGGACNVAANIAALGAQATFIGAVGQGDWAGRRLADVLAERGVGTRLVQVLDRRTTLKTRVLARNQQVVRVDHEDRSPLPAEPSAELLAAVAECCAAADAILLSDYDKGALTAANVDGILGMAHVAGRMVTAGPKPATARHYRGAALISLNRAEAEAAIGHSLATGVAMLAAAERLRGELEARALFITCGGDGIAVAAGGASPSVAPPFPVEVFDAAGCGDSVIAASTLALASGATAAECADIGNLAGGAQVRHVGVAAVTPDDLRQVCRSGR